MVKSAKRYCDRMATLVLHVGIPKTGSSALQVAFAQQRDTLADHGITYPAARNDSAARAGRVTGGNGTALLPHLASEAPSPAVLDRVREELAEADRFVLYSSEAMWRARPNRMAELMAVADDVRVVAFLRDPVSHAVASHAQMVSAMGYEGTLLEYVRGEKAPPYRPNLRKRLETFARMADLRVMHYEAHRANLLSAFTEAAFGKPVPLVDVGEVNKTAAVNEPAPDVIAALRGLLAADVAWLNETYMKQTPLRIG